jgi:hypothetical protein
VARKEESRTAKDKDAERACKKAGVCFRSHQEIPAENVEEAATGKPEAVERYENYLAARREAYHRKKQEAERTA